MIGNNDNEISVDDLSSSEVDPKGLESMNKLMGRLGMVNHFGENMSLKSSEPFDQLIDLSFSRKDSPTVSANRNEVQEYDLNIGQGLLEASQDKEGFKNGSSGGADNK